MKGAYNVFSKETVKGKYDTFIWPHPFVLEANEFLMDPKVPAVAQKNEKR